MQRVDRDGSHGDARPFNTRAPTTNVGIACDMRVNHCRHTLSVLYTNLPPQAWVAILRIPHHDQGQEQPVSRLVSPFRRRQVQRPLARHADEVDQPRDCAPAQDPAGKAEYSPPGSL